MIFDLMIFILLNFHLYLNRLKIEPIIFNPNYDTFFYYLYLTLLIYYCYCSLLVFYGDFDFVSSVI